MLNWVAPPPRLAICDGENPSLWNSSVRRYRSIDVIGASTGCPAESSADRHSHSNLSRCSRYLRYEATADRVTRRILSDGSENLLTGRSQKRGGFFSQFS